MYLVLGAMSWRAAEVCPCGADLACCSLIRVCEPILHQYHRKVIRRECCGAVPLIEAADVCHVL